MAKYLFQGSYSVTGAQGLASVGGSSRRDQVAGMMESMGGQLESFYYAFGDSDVIGIADIPDHVTAAALSLAINSSGAVSINIVVLMTPEEMDAAAKMTVTYTPPGG